MLQFGKEDGRRGYGLRSGTMNPLLWRAQRSIAQRIVPLLFLILVFGTLIYLWNKHSSSNFSLFFPPALPGQLSGSSYPLSGLTNLIMVAGHSVYTSTSCGPLDANPSWFLEPYQVAPTAASSFVQHIRQGVESAAKDPSSLLLFSGGQTRRSAGPRSEAVSYWMAAEASEWFGA